MEYFEVDSCVYRRGVLNFEHSLLASQAATDSIGPEAKNPKDEINSLEEQRTSSKDISPSAEHKCPSRCELPSQASKQFKYR
jgi:hypothetical protein